MSKYNVGLKTILQGGLSEPKLYGDLVYKFRQKCWQNLFFRTSGPNPPLPAPTYSSFPTERSKVVPPLQLLFVRL